MLEALGKVSMPGPVVHHLPRSSTVTGTPACASRSAATPPPKPEPMITTRCSSRVTGTAALPRAATAKVAALAPAALRKERREIFMLGQFPHSAQQSNEESARGSARTDLVDARHARRCR